MMEEEAEGLLQDPSTGVLEPPKYDMPRRRPWAPEEVRMLYKAVSKHGAGKWKEILEDEEFAHAFMGRVNGNLKDKWRNLRKMNPWQSQKAEKEAKKLQRLKKKEERERKRALESEMYGQAYGDQHGAMHGQDGSLIGGLHKKSKAPRRLWTNDELHALERGVEKYGVGQWTLILDDPETGPHLKQRDGTALKDKWRNLNRLGNGRGRGRGSRSMSADGSAFLDAEHPHHQGQAGDQMSSDYPDGGAEYLAQSHGEHGTSMHSGGGSTPLRLKWSQNEIDALRVGVHRYGEGRWALILQDSELMRVLSNRSNTDLKDKWRRLNPYRPVVLDTRKNLAGAPASLEIMIAYVILHHNQRVKGSSVQRITEGVIQLLEGQGSLLSFNSREKFSEYRTLVYNVLKDGEKQGKFSRDPNKMSFRLTKGMREAIKNHALPEEWAHRRQFRYR